MLVAAAAGHEPELQPKCRSYRSFCSILPTRAWGIVCSSPARRLLGCSHATVSPNGAAACSATHMPPPSLAGPQSRRHGDLSVLVLVVGESGAASHATAVRPPSDQLAFALSSGNRRRVFLWPERAGTGSRLSPLRRHDVAATTQGEDGFQAPERRASEAAHQTRSVVQGAQSRLVAAPGTRGVASSTATTLTSFARPRRLHPS